MLRRTCGFQNHPAAGRGRVDEFMHQPGISLFRAGPQWSRGGPCPRRRCRRRCAKCEAPLGGPQWSSGRAPSEPATVSAPGCRSARTSSPGPDTPRTITVPNGVASMKSLASSNVANVSMIFPGAASSSMRAARCTLFANRVIIHAQIAADRMDDDFTRAASRSGWQPHGRAGSPRRAPRPRPASPWPLGKRGWHDPHGREGRRTGP